MQEIVETKEKSVYQEKVDILMHLLEFYYSFIIMLITIKNRKGVELTERYP